jgi:AcrR family transcriptional regulator
MVAPRGRPPKSKQRLTRDIILSAAAKRLGKPDGSALSLRSIAADLDVTPMSLYAYVDGVDGILNALADRWFSEIPEPNQDEPVDGLRMLLTWYCELVLKHPRLTLELVSRHGAIPAPHQAWTNWVVGLIGAAGFTTEWSDILIDHLHGFALSQAAADGDSQGVLAIYQNQIDVLFDVLKPNAKTITS